MIVLSLIILAIAIYVKYIRKDFFKLIINNNKLKPSQMYSKCLCFCGGGVRSFYGHYGVLTGLLNQIGAEIRITKTQIFPSTPGGAGGGREDGNNSDPSNELKKYK